MINRLNYIVSKRKGEIISSTDKIATLKCSRHHTWEAPIPSIIHGRVWCEICRIKSQGEMMVANILREKKIPFVTEVWFPELPCRRFDFLVNGNTIIEVDGIQHYEWTKRFHRSKKKFQELQRIDTLKTFMALVMGYKIIRIDYTFQYEYQIAAFLEKALESSEHLCLSTPRMYEWLNISKLSPSLFANEKQTSPLMEFIINSLF